MCIKQFNENIAIIPCIFNVTKSAHLALEAATLPFCLALIQGLHAFFSMVSYRGRLDWWSDAMTFPVGE